MRIKKKNNKTRKMKCNTNILLDKLYTDTLILIRTNLFRMMNVKSCQSISSTTDESGRYVEMSERTIE